MDIISEIMNSAIPRYFRES